MSTDIFLRIEGITGESQDANHKGWINVDSFDLPPGLDTTFS